MGGPCFLVNANGSRKVRGPSCTDNFQVRPFNFDGESWHSVEQCYQAMKYTNRSRQLIQQSSPHENESDRDYGHRVWFIGQQDRNIRHDWEQIKIDMMYDICLAKYMDNEDLQHDLLATGEDKIVGAPSTWKWQKWNGIIQSEIRKALREMKHEDL